MCRLCLVWLLNARMLLGLCYGGSGQLQLTKERICNSIHKLVRGRWWGLLVQLMAESRSESALGKPRMRSVERVSDPGRFVTPDMFSLVYVFQLCELHASTG